MTTAAKTTKRTAASNGNLRDRIRASEVSGKLYKVKEWDVEVELRSLTVKRKNALTDATEDLDEFTSGVVMGTCYDPKTGEPIFTDEGDAEWIVAQPASVIEPLLFEALRHSGMSETDLAEALEEGKGGS